MDVVNPSELSAKTLSPTLFMFPTVEARSHGTNLRKKSRIAAVSQIVIYL